MKKQKTAEQLRHFGLEMALILNLFALFFIWYEKRAGLVFSLVGGVFLLAAVFVPTWLRTFEKLWMGLGELLGKIVTPLILVLVYYLAVVPMGLLVRILRKDLLALKLDPDAKSYWAEVEKNGPSERHYTPY